MENSSFHNKIYKEKKIEKNTPSCVLFFCKIGVDMKRSCNTVAYNYSTYTGWTIKDVPPGSPQEAPTLGAS